MADQIVNIIILNSLNTFFDCQVFFAFVKTKNYTYSTKIIFSIKKINFKVDNKKL